MRPPNPTADELGSLRPAQPGRRPRTTRAGAGALEGRRSLGVGQPVAHDTKSSPTDPVTEYDRAAEQLIVDALRSSRPDDAIVGEEGADDAGISGLEWHIDPIDGTANFVYDLPSWCTSVAVVDAHGPLAGAVYVPVADELFSAARGSGATLNGASITCSSVAELSQRARRDRVQLLGRTSRPAGSTPDRASCPRYATSVASARPRSTSASSPAGASTPTSRNTSTPWDLAAGVLIAQEAGAITSDLSGGPAGSVATVAAAPGIHRELVITINVIDS